MARTKVITFFVLISIFFGFANHNVSADFDCSTFIGTPTADQRQICQTELDALMAELAGYQKELTAQQKNTGTIKGDLVYIASQIKALQAKIKSRLIIIAQLKASIVEKVNQITSLSAKIDREHESLAQLLRNTNEFDQETMVHLVLSDDSISNFYSDLESYASIKQAVKTSVDTIKGVKTQTEVAKQDLQKQQNAQTDAKAELEKTQKQVTATQNEQKQLLEVSKQKEAAYQNVIADRQARVSAIKARLFQLAGGSQPIRFDIALQYAESASLKTSVDPAFLLAILTQESNLGSNVGQCYLTDSTSGAGVGISSGKAWSNLMNPTRDVPVFLDITNGLGFSAFKTAVSCPIAGVRGYGGAMGPAQFIPSTWKLFDTRVSNITGVAPANPWQPNDAFIASALYLSDLGGTGTSTSAQSRAACRYYGSGGSTCSYSRSVINLKNKIQSDIDYLKQYGVTKS